MRRQKNPHQMVRKEQTKVKQNERAVTFDPYWPAYHSLILFQYLLFNFHKQDKKTKSDVACSCVVFDSPSPLGFEGGSSP